MIKDVINAGIARSKDSVTHFFANVTIFLSAAAEGVLDLFSMIDPELHQQLVSVVAQDNIKLSARVALVLMIGTKMSRDRRWIPFTKSEPHDGGQP